MEADTLTMDMPPGEAACREIEQLIYRWAHDLDTKNGLNVVELLDDACRYAVGERWVTGKHAVAEHYQQRLARLSVTPEGAPTQRHLITNLLFLSNDDEGVSVKFSLIYFSSAGREPPFGTDPAAVADVWMVCRQSASGSWRIAMFDSNQPFRR